MLSSNKNSSATDLTKCDELMDLENDLPSATKKRRLQPHPSNVVEPADSQDTLALSPGAGVRASQLKKS